jgi:tetratricopeptide (TPR) repeat protein
MPSRADDEPEQRARVPLLRRPELRVGAGLFAASFALFAPAIGFPLVAFDDFEYLRDNPQLRGGPSLEAVFWAFRSDYFSNWHPLTWLSYLLDLALFGPSAAGHHFGNVLLHAGSAALLGAGLARATGRAGASFFAAALWALHPLRVESVAWVSQRKDVLAIALGLLALGAHLRAVRSGRRAAHALTALCLAAGLLAKPVLVTLPLLLLLVDHWPLARAEARTARARARRWLALGLEKLPLAALALGAAWITLAVQSGARAPSPEQEIPLVLRVANAVYSLACYVAKTLWPAQLSAYYPHPFLPGGTPPGARVWIAAAALAFATLLAWRLRARRYVWCGWLWLGIALIPNLGLVQVGMQGMADRYSYWSSVGLCTALGLGLADAAERWLAPRIARALALALLGCLALATSAQLRVWRSTEALFLHAVALDSRNWFAHAQLGDLALAAGRDAEAVAHFERALAVAPHSGRLWYSLGLAEARRGDPAAAASAYQRAVLAEPGHMKAQRALAKLLFAAGRVDEAIGRWRAAVAAAPRNHKLRLELGLALWARGSRAEAARELAAARARSVEVGDRDSAERAERALVELGR